MSEHANGGAPQKASPKKKMDSKKWRTVGRVLGTLLLIGVLTGLMVLGSLYYYVANYLDPQMNVDLDSYKLAYTSYVYYTDQNGEEKILESLYGDENREWVDLDDIPETLINAFISTEDKRFRTHHGVDWIRTGFAVLNTFTSQSSTKQGGSTLTQQLIKNLTNDKSVSISRKLREIFSALNLEKEY